MIGIFLGGQNSGKSLSMVYFANEYFKNGFDIYSNLKLNIPYNVLSMQLIEEYTIGQKQFNNSVFIIDELYLFMDSRSSGSNKNKIMTYFLLQTSKRNVHLLGTAQRFNTVEKRFRENCTFQSHCKRVIKHKGKYYNIKSNLRELNKEENNLLYIENCILKADTEGFDYGIDTKKIYIKAKPIFNLYDTRELLAI